MTIELLWIMPVVAFSFFIFLLIYNATKTENNPYKKLSEEVARFNNGMHNPVQSLQVTPEKRLDELEKAILSVNESIANQQKIVNKVNLENTANNSEIETLRKKLHELQSEYDIVSSENFSLKARIRFLMENKSAEEKTEINMPEAPPSLNSNGKINLKLYEDTRLVNLTQLEKSDESEKTNVG